MTKFNKVKTISELESGFPTYCKALRLLVEQGNSLEKIKRTICWDYLQRLHSSLPRTYHSPDYLFYRILSEKTYLLEA